MSRIFSTSSGSGEILNSSSRHGLSPNAFQISATVWCEIPCLAARPRVDQWVASAGAVSNVSTTTASTTSSVILRVAPGRGASTNPSNRSAANRCRHLVTVGGEHPTSAAIDSRVRPGSAHANTIRDRNANACDDECRRAHRVNVSRSAADKTICGLGRPGRAMLGLQCCGYATTTRIPTCQFPPTNNFSTDQPDRTLAPR